MPSPINFYTSQITPKQKKDLLGIYQDYLYFERGLELAYKINSTAGLAAIFMKQMNWIDNMNMRWNFNFTTPSENDDYVKLTNGTLKDPKQHAFMSLYHTKKEQDVAHKKISTFPKGYTYTTLDLNLPCPIERYAITLPPDQKFKDAKIIIDGLFKVTFNKEYKDQGDTPLLNILAEHKTQKEFKVLLSLMEYYHRNMYALERDHAKDFSKYVSNVMVKILASEVISGFENKALDLIGSYADKTQEILRSIFPNTSTKDLWQIAEKNGLIASSENMQHYLNIRHLMRHQWDSLDGSNKYAGNKNKNEKMREEYLASYHFLFDKPLPERIKEYQKITRQLQPLLMVLYPEFLARETGESNSKFAKRIKLWQKQNPNKVPLITGNYLLKDEKHTSLVNNLRKVAATAIILDDMNPDELEKFNDMEESYFNRTDFLRNYNHLESDVTIFCQNNGISLKPADIWNFLKTNIFNEEEYKRWSDYRHLRNRLSHNHFNKELRAELDNKIDQYEKDMLQLYKKMENYELTHAKTKKAADKQQPGYIPQKAAPSNKPLKKYPFKLIYGNKEILECQFDNGISIDFKRKKVIFPDNTRIYCDAKDFNVIRFENGNKLFTDKTFRITKFLEHGRPTQVSRNEFFIAAPKHKIRTDKNNRVAENCIIINDKRFVTQFNYINNEAVITLEDGSKIKTSANDFAISHNNIELTYENRYAFKQSYLDEPPTPTPPFKPPFSR